VARNFRFYEKKRGHRRTGSPALASAGEAAFFGVLLAVGGAWIVLAVLWLVIPEWRVNHGFVEQTCKVVASGIGEKETENGTVYRPEVKIEYEVNGIKYLPVTYDIHHDRAWSSSRDEAQQLADRFVDKQNYPCWYDPADPGRAVLVRGYQWWIWLVFAVPISLVVIGAGGLVYTIVRWGKSTEFRAAMTRRAAPLDLLDPGLPASPSLATVPDGSDIESSPGTKLAFRLPLTRSPAWNVFGLLLASVLWNAPVVVFVAGAVGKHLDGEPDWIYTLFAAACLAGGIALLVCFIRQLLVATGIGPTLVEISAHPLLPGGQYQLFVSQSGRLKVKSLEVALVCEEEATYRQGTNTRTEAREVARQPVLLREGFAIRHGEPFSAECLLQVPPGAMHSFKAVHNQVHWKLVVRGQAAGRPKFERAFPVIVNPAQARSTA
jgi:hypothetical protein